MLYARIGDAARRTAIARTGSDPGTYLTLDLSGATPEDRAAIAAAARASRTGEAAGDHLIVDATDATDATAEAIAAAVRGVLAAQVEREAQAAREQAARETAAREHAAEVVGAEDAVERLLAHPYPHPAGYHSSHYGDYRAAYDAMPGIAELRELARAEADRREAARIAAARAEAAAGAAAQGASEITRAAIVARWLAEAATDEQRQRAAEGLLPAGEVEDGIRRVIADALPRVGRPPYDRITGAEVRAACDALQDPDDCDDCDCDDGGCAPSYDAEDAESASAEEFAALCQVRATLASVGTALGLPVTIYVRLRRHSGSCTNRSHAGYATVERASIRVLASIPHYSVRQLYAV